MPVPATLLAQLPLLAGLPQVTLAHLAQHASARLFAKREVVLQKGGEGNVFCFLLAGRLQAVDFTVDGREVGLYFVNPGDYFGDIAVIDGQPQPVYVTAVSSVATRLSATATGVLSFRLVTFSVTLCTAEALPAASRACTP